MRAIKAPLWNRLAASLFAPALILAAVVWSAVVHAENAPEPTVRLKGEVLHVLGSAKQLPKVETAAAQPITLTIMLNWSDPAGFDSYFRSFQDRASPLFRQRLAPEEVTSRFGPTQASYDLVTAYLRQNGFTPVRTSSNRLTLTVRGTRAQAERAFDVSINDYQLGARHFYANDTEPAVPQSLAPIIRSISGLSNLAQPRPAAAPSPVSPLSFTTAYNGLLTPAHGSNSGGLPPGVNGAGQTIALVEFDNFQSYELTASLVASGLPAALSNQVSIVNVNGGTGESRGSGTQEVLLDIVVALGVAPSANIIVVDAPNSGDPHIDVIAAAFEQVRGVPGQQSGIISDSWSACETEYSDSDLDSMEGILQALAIYSVSFFAATSDNGSSCKNLSQGLQTGVTLPPAAPDAVAVGGTSLQVAAGNGYQSESWWTQSGLAGGFGVSQHFGRPNYQDRYTNASGRSVPDVSADAGDGAAIVCIFLQPCGPQRGVSAATPFWAAVWALACQTTKSPCASANGSFLYNDVNLGAFHLASTMAGAGNDFAHVGLGSPNITNLVSYLAGPPSITSISPSLGPMSGGTGVLINGENFIGVSDVRFSGTPSPAFIVLSTSQIAAISPPCPVLSACDTNSTSTGADISFHTPAGFAVTPPGAHFLYVGSITSVTPNSGPMAGGTTVAVAGSGFRPGLNQTFLFGSVPAVNAQCSSTTECTMGSPAASAPIQVDMTYGGWPTNAQDIFTYSGPQVTDVIPPTGSENGGDTVTIIGFGFSNNMTLMFGATPITNFACSADGTWCDLSTPPGTGQVDITFTANGLTSTKNPHDVFTYEAVPFGTMSPTSGLESGGTVITVTGGNFSTTPGATSFTFNFPGIVKPATNVTCASTTQCKFTSPPWDPDMIGDLSPVSATVNGVTGRVGQFTYGLPVPPPGSLLGVGLDPGNVGYGQSAKLTVLISAPDKPEAVTVALSSSKPSLAAVPASVTIPAGALDATFTINTSHPPPPPPRFETVDISATVGGATQVGTLIIGAPPGHGGDGGGGCGGVKC